MVNHLHLFAKDTSATATERGFQFQRLKTLECWLVNRLGKRDEVIYCDFQEDILSVKVDQSLMRFQQIKLYSTQFSFKSREIRHTIFNFFLLWNKFATQQTETLFYFVTNTGIAKDVRGNDADLLKLWQEQQHDLSQSVFERCSSLVQQIVIEIAEETIEKIRLKDSDVDYSVVLEECRHLPASTWDRFIRAIRWEFSNEEPDQGIESITQRIIRLISQLPLPIDREKIMSHLSLLHYEIARCTASEDPHDRKLTPIDIDILLLDQGDQTSRWYSQSIERIGMAPLLSFYPDAFYELFRAIRYFGRHLPLSGHYDIWMNVLGRYMDLDTLPIAHRRKTIYLQVYILSVIEVNGRVWFGVIQLLKTWIYYYFEKFPIQYDPEQAKDDPMMIESLRSVPGFVPAIFPEGQIEKWALMVEDHLTESRRNAQPGDETCRASEVLGYAEFGKRMNERMDLRVNATLAYHKDIVIHSQQAETFDPNDLVMMYQRFSEQLIDRRLDDPMLMDQVDELLNALDTLKIKQGQQSAMGAKLVERAGQYLNKEKHLDALNALFKAAAYFRQHNTKDDLSFTYLRISKIYGSLKLYYLSKQFALTSLDILQNFGRKAEQYFLGDALAFRFVADFEQGQWLSALISFTPYFVARKLVDTKENIARTANRDEDLTISFKNVAMILVLLPKINPVVSSIVQAQKDFLETNIPGFSARFIEPIEASLALEPNPASFLKKFIYGNPAQEIGATKTISLQMLGVSWVVQGPNDYAFNAILEEFVALLQGVLWGIGAYGFDLHLQLIVILIQVKEREQISFTPVESFPCMRIWHFYTSPTTEADSEMLNRYCWFLMVGIRQILRSISMLPSEVFDSHFDQLLEQHKWGLKLTAETSYQNMYCVDSSERSIFDRQNRSQLAYSAPNKILHGLTPVFFDSRGVLSPILDEAKILKAIEGFYKRASETLSISIGEWLQEPLFHICLEEWRRYRWLDWQILMALENFVIDHKANDLVRKMNLDDDAASMKAVETEVARLMTIPESESYCQVPVDLLHSELFEFYLSKTVVNNDILAIYGLRCSGNSYELQDALVFLRSRCKFESIDLPHLSPLRKFKNN